MGTLADVIKRENVKMGKGEHLLEKGKKVREKENAKQKDKY
jgi:hypothetical protein